MHGRKSLARLRFYEELNDFLAPGRRKRDIDLPFEAPAPVRHLIETLGVPHTEVELIIANGESVGLDYAVADGDRIGIYPMFEALDVTPLLRLRDKPLRDPCFIADAHLGKLAHYLRMLGFDTLFDIDLDDREISAISARERRVLLSRDKALLMRRSVTHGCYVRALAPRQQLADVMRRMDLYRLIRPFTRCMQCNGGLHPVSRHRVYNRLPADTRRHFSKFWQCAGCRHVYWQGSHYARMRDFIAELNASVGERETD